MDATGADPAAARALVEAFQSGVRRAELNAAPGNGHPGVTVDPRTSPGGPAPAVADSNGATPGRPLLSRRVPGANVTATAPAQPASPHLGDPAEVRDLITDFEAGVARALREVSPDRRNEEGSAQ